MELLASPSLFFAFLAGTVFGDLLAGRFPLSFVSPRGELMSSGRLFVRPRIGHFRIPGIGLELACK